MTRRSVEYAREHLQIRRAGEFEPGPNSVLAAVTTARTAAISADYRNRWLALCTGMLLLLLDGCAMTATQQLATNLSAALANQNDPALVRDGAPAHLLLLEGLLEGDPGNEELLLAAARMYGAYATLFVKDKERARSMAETARGYAARALCQRRPDTCGAENLPFDEFTALFDTMDQQDLRALYAYAVAWTSWVQTSGPGDFDALANLPRIATMMERVLVLDEHYDHGQAHVYLGAMDCRLSATLGGRPEKGRLHFERAIALSNGRNLRAQVEYARRCARLTFDRELHDRLLNDVLAADPDEPGLTLSNVLARQEARILLDTSADYFE
jgi:hypothetical protein